MAGTMLRWIGDETLLQQFLAGFSTTTLLIIIAVFHPAQSTKSWIICVFHEIDQRLAQPWAIIRSISISIPIKNVR